MSLPYKSVIRLKKSFLPNRRSYSVNYSYVNINDDVIKIVVHINSVNRSIWAHFQTKKKLEFPRLKILSHKFYSILPPMASASVFHRTSHRPQIPFFISKLFANLDPKTNFKSKSLDPVTWKFTSCFSFSVFFYFSLIVSES